METLPWASIVLDNGVHVIPCGDLMTHEDEDCVCIPTEELHTGAAGQDSWLHIHHSLDGREGRE